MSEKKNVVSVILKKSVGGSSVQFSAPLLPLALLMLHIQKHLELVCVIRATVENYVCIENLSQKEEIQIIIWILYSTRGKYNGQN